MNLEGKNFTRLTEGAGQHDRWGGSPPIRFAPSREFFLDTHSSVEDHLEGEYYFTEKDVRYFASYLTGSEDPDEEGALDHRWISKCTADSPHAKYNYLRETWDGLLRLTVPGECGKVREQPEALLELDKVVMRDQNDREVTYGDLLDWVQNTYPRLVKAHPFQEYDYQGPDGALTGVSPPAESSAVREPLIMEREVVAELRLFKKDYPAWSWRKMEGEFNLAMGYRGVSASTLSRMFNGKTNTQTPLTAQFILKAISKIRERAEAVKGIPDELPGEIPSDVPEKKKPYFMNSLRKKFFKG